jgi:hypothetical protein
MSNLNAARETGRKDTPSMTDETPAHVFNIVPVYHWHGARPFPLDLGEAESGSAAWLVLIREGDLCLVPLEWDRNNPQNETRRLPCLVSVPNAATLHEILGDLERDGWHICGRLDARFTGDYAGDLPVYPIQAT